MSSTGSNSDYGTTLILSTGREIKARKKEEKTLRQSKKEKKKKKIKTEMPEMCQSKYKYKVITSMLMQMLLRLSQKIYLPGDRNCNLWQSVIALHSSIMDWPSSRLEQNSKEYTKTVNYGKTFFSYLPQS